MRVRRKVFCYFCIDLPHSRRRPLATCFSILVGLKFSASNVARVDFDIVVPLLRQIGLRENCRHGTDRHTGATINALSRIDVQLRRFIVRRAAIFVGPSFCRMDTIHRAHVHTRRVLVPMQGSAMMYAIGQPPQAGSSPSESILIPFLEVESHLLALLAPSILCKGFRLDRDTRPDNCRRRTPTSSHSVDIHEYEACACL